MKTELQLIAAILLLGMGVAKSQSNAVGSIKLGVFSQGEAWESRSSGAGGTIPSARESHNAIWTGTEMIIWGGNYDFTSWPTGGGRYNPVTKKWSPISTNNAPSPRYWSSAVWTGTEMIIWGGYDSTSQEVNTGARYNVANDSWTPLPTLGAPAAHSFVTAIWTGSEMLIWGGADGAKYNPTSNTWTPIPTNSAPNGSGSSAVWTGSEMIVYRGPGTNLSGRYNPAANSWSAISTNNAPPYTGHSFNLLIWTGSRVIVCNGGTNKNGIYDPSSNSWSPMSTNGAPKTSASQTAVRATAEWDGSNMVVYNSFDVLPGAINPARGSKYNPITDTWTPISTNGSPVFRLYHSSIWTGSKMIIWGGGFYLYNNGYKYYNDGGAYDSATDTWTPITGEDMPSKRTGHTTLWTGTEMIVWGGASNSTTFDDGGRFDPLQNKWTTILPSGIESRTLHRAVWTGTEMIVLGGKKYLPSFSGAAPSIARYNLTNGQWRGSSQNVPENEFEAVWTGSEVLIWGFQSSFSLSARKYNPTTDTISALSLAGSPQARSGETAVWTGTEMIIWGGLYFGSPLNNGGRYNPVSNAWYSISTTNAPPGGSGHTAIWTGTEMIIWGGDTGNGKRYNPSSNIWISISTTNAPVVRGSHSAVWTGTEMIVWGGGNSLITGGRYNPASNTWSVLTTNGVSPGRSGHGAVWTGTEMVVWGGTGTNGVSASPYSYKPLARLTPVTWTAIVGRQYQVQYRTNLSQPNWIDLGSPVVAPSTNGIAYDTFQGNSQRYYRVALLP